MNPPTASNSTSSSTSATSDSVRSDRSDPFARPAVEHVPPLEICGPNGDRLTVTPTGGDDTIRDLAAALDVAPTRRLLVDDRSTVGGQRLVDTGLLCGSAVSIDGIGTTSWHTDSAIRAGAGDHADRPRVTITAGPDCRHVGPIELGRSTVGRSPTSQLRVDDPTVELHHVALDVAVDSVRVTQLAGQIPVTIDGAPVSSPATFSYPVQLALGTTELTFVRARHRHDSDASSHGPAGALTDRAGDPWRREVRRGPCSLPALSLAPIEPPASGQRTPIPSAVGLVGAAIAVVGAVVLATVLGQTMFALFALIGAVASLGTWGVGALDAWRRNRRGRTNAAADRRRFHDELEAHQIAAHRHHSGLHSDVLAALGTTISLANERSEVWNRRLWTQAGDPMDRLRCVLGRGDLRWPVPVATGERGDAESDAAIDAAGRLADVAVPLVIDSGDVVALHGPADLTGALLRSMLVQLAVTVGPADWQLVVVTTHPEQWQWAAWLPHGRDATNRPMIAPSRDDAALTALFESVPIDPLRPTVLIVDDPGVFAVRTGALRRFLDTAKPATLAVVDRDRTIPAVCNRTVVVGPTGRLRIDDEHAPTEVRDVLLAGITERTALVAARRLASLADPEASGGQDGRLPASVSLADVDPTLVGGAERRRVSARRIADRWRAGGPDPAPSTPLGRSADGSVEVDLVRDGPHALIAGTTGSGKSELLRSLVVGLAGQLSPDHLTFVLVDYKGGSTFDACAQLPHTVGVVTDLDDGLAARALASLDAELHRRERMLRSVGASDLAEYRLHDDAVTLPRLVVVIDEFAALAKELPDFLSALVGIAQRGRSLGVHLVLATQRPAGVVTDEIRANTNLRLALRLNDAADAHDVVDDARPTDFARSVPGRAALRLGPDELIVFQATRCTGPAITSSHGLVVSDASGPAPSPDSGAERSELAVAVATIRDAVQLADIDAPHRPWVDALPAELAAHDVDDVAGDGEPHDAVGLVDVPSEQRRQPLRWDRSRGHLALVGSVGSGTTSTLISVIAATCRTAAPTSEHWFVIDARGDHALDGVAGIAHCGAVVRPGERERLHRLLARLDALIDRPSMPGEERPATSLAIDGLASLRTALSSIEMAPTLALLERVLADGPSAGVACCWTDDGSTSANWATASDTWIFHVDDSGVARSFGVAPVRSGQPGRLRVASTGLDGQVAAGADGMAELPCRCDSAGPDAVGALPPEVWRADLVRPPAPVRPTIEQFVVGVGADDLATSTLSVPSGDHIFVAGAAGTGRSTALRALVDEWLARHPDGTVIEINRRTVPTTEDVAGWSGATLVAIDDAERVDDPHGVLSRLINDPSPGVIVVAAARLDAVRSAYGHWTRDVARSRCGIILTSPGEIDGDLLGVTLPRRSLIAPRPGLGWVVDGAGHRLVQLARP